METLAVIADKQSLSLRLIVVGGGGHAKVLVSTLLMQHRRIIGFVDPKPTVSSLLGIAHLGADSVVFLHQPDHIRLINGLGSIDSTVLRRTVYDKFRTRRYTFETVIHLSAVVAPDVQIEDGVQVMAGGVVQSGSRLGSNVIINTGARVDHDCLIAAHAHIGPGATLSGNVHIGTGAHVGTGASIIQGVEVGAAAVVGAGAVVIDYVPSGATVVGVPARVMANPIATI